MKKPLTKMALILSLSATVFGTVLSGCGKASGTDTSPETTTSGEKTYETIEAFPSIPADAATAGNNILIAAEKYYDGAIDNTEFSKIVSDNIGTITAAADANRANFIIGNLSTAANDLSAGMSDPHSAAALEAIKSLYFALKDGRKY